MKELAIHTDNADIHLLPASGYCVRYTPDAPVIGFAYELQEGSHAFASSRSTPFCSMPNSLAYTPAGCDIYSESPSGGEYLKIQIHNMPASEIFHNFRSERQFSNQSNRKAASAALNIRSLLLSQDRTCLSYECELHNLLDAVTEELQINEPNTSGAAASITPRRLRAIHEKIELNLSEELTLEDLAKTAELSKGYFNRAFKAATGLQPYKYLMTRRIAHARRLLKSTPDSLTDIAYQCGFSSHAHMTTAFKRHLGVTPSAYRDIIS